jgi:hypothetical protein
MHRNAIVLICVVCLCVAAPVLAGKIALYADPGRESCELVDVFPGVVQIHLFYEGDLGAQSVYLAAPTPECWTDAVWVGDVIMDQWRAGYGDTHDVTKGALILLLGCERGPLYLGYMSFQALGRGEACCAYEIVGTEIEGPPGVIDCTGDNFVVMETGDLVVNPGPGCACVNGNIIVAVEEQTWGRVKALYR